MTAGKNKTEYIEFEWQIKTYNGECYKKFKMMPRAFKCLKTLRARKQRECIGTVNDAELNRKVLIDLGIHFYEDKHDNINFLMDDEEINGHILKVMKNESQEKLDCLSKTPWEITKTINGMRHADGINYTKEFIRALSQNYELGLDYYGLPPVEPIDF